MRHVHVLVAFAVCSACAHTPDLPLRPDPTPPPGSTAAQFAAIDGTPLYERHWPATTDTRGVVVIVHGLKDHSDRYATFATTLAAHGYAVYAFDLRGHGRSAGPRVAQEFNDYVGDVDRFVTTVEHREPGKPVFVFGHSMGGEIAARVAELHEPRLAGVVLSGAALAVDVPPLLLAASRLSALLTPRAPALSLDNHDFSSDPANAAVMDRDELILQTPAPAHTADSLFAGMHELWRDLDRLTIPLLALHGSADRLTSPSASRAFVDGAPTTDKALRIYDGYFHDLLHEPGGKGAHVADDIVAWLDAHTGGPAVAAPPRYDGPLTGDPRGWTQDVELAAGVSDRSSTTAFAGRAAIELARPRPIGWHGSITARLLDGDRAVALRPIGIAVRAGGSALGISGGGALVSGTTFALSGGAWLVQTLGPVGQLSGFAEIERRDTTRYLAGGSLRLGGDRSYWPGARAGVGPMIVAGVDHAGATGWFAMLGLQLFAGD